MGLVPLLTLGLCGAARGAQPYFTVTVVDEQTGRGVPLVELRTVNDIRHVTDSNGIVALYEPGLMGQTVFFTVSGHGYEFPADGFGYRGVALQVTEGGGAEIRVKRINIAERLYRITGEGIYRDSVVVGRPVPTQHPLLNALVFGSDSVLNTVYRGRVYWFWGDTNRPSYPLGNFHTPGATSLPPADGGLAAERGVDLDYFVDANGFAKETAHLPGEGPTWLSGLVALKDEAGRERLFAAYAKVRQSMEAYERGLVEFNDDRQQFEKVASFDLKVPALPGGHPFIHVVDGVRYVYFATPYPLVRIRAEPEALKDLARYEAFTCLKEGTRLDEMQVDRRADGTVRYDWKGNTPPVGPGDQAKLTKAGKLRPGEALLQLQDCDTGDPVLAHAGSVYWNEYRRRWVMIAEQAYGTSMLGEIWYAEADSPLGPWVYARKIVTHEKYSFYNPKQDPMFDQEGGRIIFFEGTYSATFSGNTDPTPRYDYNQVMYRLDLSDPRLALPGPVRGLSGVGEGSVPFFAPDRPAPETVLVCLVRGDGGDPHLVVGQVGDRAEPLFCALPHDTAKPPATTAPLYECTEEGGGRHVYLTGDSRTPARFRRSGKPLCLVWRNPMCWGLPREGP